MTPPTTPPASTSEIARALSAGAATSAAAKRYCRPIALYTPITAVATQNSAKLCCDSATTPIAQPTMLTRRRS